MGFGVSVDSSETVQLAVARNMRCGTSILQGRAQGNLGKEAGQALQDDRQLSI
jgi:hypothetical protein